MAACSYENRNRRHKGDGGGSGPFPDCIYDIIVSYLPVRDAIRCSLVSRAWRFRWRSVPCLVFCDDPDMTFEEQSHAREKNARFLTRVLPLHGGRIKRFEVTMGLNNNNPMDVWIPALTVSGIEQFIFSTSYRSYLIPSDLFSFHGLTTLKLFSCTLRVPPEAQFTGFPNLNELFLEDIDMANTTRCLGRLITSCRKLRRLSIVNISASLGDMWGCEASAPSLEWLDLEMIDYYGPVRIDAPKVVFTKFLTFFTFESYSTEDMPNIFSLIATLRGIPNVQKLAIDSIGAFPLDNVAEVPFELPCLTHLQLVVDFICMDEIIAAFYLVRSAPMLKQLHVKSGREYIGHGLANSFWEIHDGDGYLLHYLHEGCKLNHLQLLEFVRPRGFPEEMTFIKFVLQNAPFLSKTDIKTKWDNPESDGTESDAGYVEDLVKDLLTMKKDAARGVICINDVEVSI